ncbi:MAG TPA: hypothetical protein VL282_00275, partial [Tepidisphaeraceae bacterium]|nr:hypothetical protein [Tepidisphaeraceae bacterium]
MLLLLLIALTSLLLALLLLLLLLPLLILLTLTIRVPLLGGFLVALGGGIAIALLLLLLRLFLISAPRIVGPLLLGRFRLLLFLRRITARVGGLFGLALLSDPTLGLATT